MKVTKHNTSEKGLLYIVLFALFSVVLNIVLVFNLMNQEERVHAKNSEVVSEKEEIILTMQEEINGLNEQLANNTPEKREDLSNTKLEQQNKYKDTAKSFVASYLTYDTNSLDKRRESISEITTIELLNKVAPEVVETDKQALSSDPTFTSNVLDSTIYVSDINETLNTGNAIVDVKYATSNTEGETTLRAIISLQLQKDEAENIKVTDYYYYPIQE